MKKVFVLALSVVLVCVLGCTAYAENETTVKVFITISNKGALSVDLEEIEVSDIDNDSVITINDVLVKAHQDYYNGETGYSYAETEYGLSITKLWGDASGSFGYYKNNASAFSLADTVSNGDYIYAFVYSDTQTWSDSYSYFNVNKASAFVGEEIDLTLFIAGYDENWNPITLPAAAASILINGEETEIKTDSDGKAIIKLDSVGTYKISATSADSTLIPPICVVEITDDEEISINIESSESEKPSTPNAGDDFNIVTVCVVALIALSAIMKINKRVYEK